MTCCIQKARCDVISDITYTHRDSESHSSALRPRGGRGKEGQKREGGTRERSEPTRAIRTLKRHAKRKVTIQVTEGQVEPGRLRAAHLAGAYINEWTKVRGKERPELERAVVAADEMS
eukprot:1323322-Amphidinium_carterae.1